MPSWNTKMSCMETLIIARRPMSTQEIAKYLTREWKTIRDNLEELYEAGFVLKGNVGKNKRIYWKPNYEAFIKLIERMDNPEKKKLKEIHLLLTSSTDAK